MAGERIVVVEPDELILKTMAQQILLPHGFKPLLAQNQTDGFKLAVAESPHLLLLHLPLPAAIELLQNLEQAGQNIPTILVVKNNATQIPIEFLRLGVRDCLTYPFTARQAFQVIERVFHPQPAVANYQHLAEGLDKINHELEQRLKEFDLLLKIGRSVNSVLDLDAVLNRVTEAAVFMTGAEEGYLLLLDPETEVLQLRAAQNFGEKQARGFSLQVSDSIAGQVVHSGRAVLLNGENKQTFKIKTGYLVKSLLNVPLKIGGRVIGVLGIDNQVSGISFTSTHTHLLSMLADIAVIALENARQYTDMRHKLARQVKEFATLQAIAGQLDAVTDFEMRARLALSLILNTINAEAGVLAWAAGQHQTSPRYIAQGALGGLGVNLPADDPAKPWWSEQNLQEVIQTGQPLLKNNFKQSHNGNGLNTRSRLAVPMRRGKQVIGAINLESISPHVFTQNDLHFVSSVANQVAIVLEGTLLQEKANTDQQFLSMLLDMVDDAVWFIDSDLNIVAQNEVAGRLTGRFEVIGRPVSDFIPSRPALCQLIDRALTERQPISFDDGVWLITKDNQPVAIRGKIAPVTRDDHVTGVLCIFQPVTVESNDNLVRQEFANMTAHLLRTPLSFLQTSIDLLRTTALTPDEQQTILNRMWERSRSLAEFTDELLEMLHMETQHVQMYVEPIELLPVLERVLNLVRCEETGQSFHLVGPTALPLAAADAAKTELVLFNMLTNAIKRSPADGCIKIETTVADDEVRIVISDQGESLPAKQLERIFGQFYPVNDDNGKIPSTYHLGLYTTKRLIELQNGRIWAENRSDRGVQFGFALPVWEQK